MIAWITDPAVIERILERRREAGLESPFDARAGVRGSAFLCGFDLFKDRRDLELTYDDPRGLTADFNRNILRVVNTRLGADFDPEALDHVGFFDPERGRIEMRLRERCPMAVDIPRAAFTFRCGTG